MNALLISGRPAVRAELEFHLNSGGFTVTVDDYAGAAAHVDRAQWPALVVLDCHAGNPWQWCQRIRGRPGGELAVVWVIVDAEDPESLKAARAGGVDDCLPWPMRWEWFELRLAAAVRQITALREIPRATAALQETVERSSLAERGAHAGVWDARPNGLPLTNADIPVWYSPELKRLFGFSEDEFPNVLGSWMSRMHPDELPSVMEEIKQALDDRSEFEIEYRLRTKGGECRWFNGRGQGIFDRQGQLVRVVGSVRDITENRRIADALQASEAKWRSLVENAPDVITVVDPEGTIQFMNRAWPGVADETSLGSNLFTRLPEEQREPARAAIQEVARTGQPRRFELTYFAAGGKRTWYGNRVGPIRSSEEIAALVIITTDITARKLHEVALHQEQELLRKLLDLHERDRQLVAYEIHDGLAQEMAAALMHLEAFHHVAAERLDGGEFDRGLALLREAVEEARRLISGLRPPVLDELGIVAAIDYLINEARADVPEIRFVHRTNFGRLAPPLESAIFRIVQEALSNIRKHSGSRRARVELFELGQHLRLVVRDWGKGFDPAEIGQRRFGLRGIRERARLLGATVVVDSRPGEGTTLVLDFPLILNRGENGIETAVNAGQ
jgi:PAS domain S-box-containing protein